MILYFKIQIEIYNLISFIFQLQLPPVDIQVRFIMSFSLYTPAIDPLVSIRLSPLVTWGVFGGTEIGTLFLDKYMFNV